jgi:hypothetical protein
MTVGWLAERLAMGTRGYLNPLLYRREKLDGESPISRTAPIIVESSKACDHLHPKRIQTRELAPPGNSRFRFAPIVRESDLP